MTEQLVCTRCGVTWMRAALLALLIDAGARTRDPSVCDDGGEHDFRHRARTLRDGSA